MQEMEKQCAKGSVLALRFTTGHKIGERYKLGATKTGQKKQIPEVQI